MKREPVAWKGYAPSGKGYPQQEIAEMMGVARSSVAEVLAKRRNGHLSIPTVNNPNTPPSTPSSTSEFPQSSADEKVLDATPYLKGGALMRPFETFICQKLKEGWSVEDFARFFNVTRERAARLIKRVHNENKIRGERRPHPEEGGAKHAGA